MNNRIFTLIAIIIIIAGVAYFWSSPTNQQNQAENPEMDTTSISERPSFEASTDTVRQRVGENLSPGTAAVRFVIESIEYDDEQPHFITGQVDEVLGYGSATSVINPGSNITLNLLDFIGTEQGSQIKIAKGDTVVITLAESKGMVKMNGSGKDLNWRIKNWVK